MYKLKVKGDGGDIDASARNWIDSKVSLLGWCENDR